MATHSNILAWKIPWTEMPGRLKSVGSQTVRHNWEPVTWYDKNTGSRLQIPPSKLALSLKLNCPFWKWSQDYLWLQLPPLSYPDLHSRIYSTQKISKGGDAQEWDLEHEHLLGTAMLKVGIKSSRRFCLLLYFDIKGRRKSKSPLCLLVFLTLASHCLVKSLAKSREFIKICW